MISVRIIAAFPMTAFRSNMAKYFFIFGDKLQLDFKVGSEFFLCYKWNFKKHKGFGYHLLILFIQKPLSAKLNSAMQESFVAQ